MYRMSLDSPAPCLHMVYALLGTASSVTNPLRYCYKSVIDVSITAKSVAFFRRTVGTQDDITQDQSFLVPERSCLVITVSHFIPKFVRISICSHFALPWRCLLSSRHSCCCQMAAWRFEGAITQCSATLGLTKPYFSLVGREFLKRDESSAPSTKILHGMTNKSEVVGRRELDRSLLAAFFALRHGRDPEDEATARLEKRG